MSVGWGSSVSWGGIGGVSWGSIGGVGWGVSVGNWSSDLGVGWLSIGDWGSDLSVGWLGIGDWSVSVSWGGIGDWGSDLGDWSNGLDDSWGRTVNDGVESVDWVGGVGDGTDGTIGLNKGVLSLDNTVGTGFGSLLVVSGQTIGNGVSVAVRWVGVNWLGGNDGYNLKSNCELKFISSGSHFVYPDLPLATGAA